MSTTQHRALDKKPATTADTLTPAQLSAYRMTGTPMSDTEATAYLLSQLSTPQLRALHAHHFPLDSNSATLRDMPEQQIAALEQEIAALEHRAEARARTDAELGEFVRAVLRSGWTKAAAAALAITVTILMLTGCTSPADSQDNAAPAQPACSSTPTAPRQPITRT